MEQQNNVTKILSFHIYELVAGSCFAASWLVTAAFCAASWLVTQPGPGSVSAKTRTASHPAAAVLRYRGSQSVRAPAAASNLSNTGRRPTDKPVVVCLAHHLTARGCWDCRVGEGGPLELHLIMRKLLPILTLTIAGQSFSNKNSFLRGIQVTISQNFFRNKLWNIQNIFS